MSLFVSYQILQLSWISYYGKRYIYSGKCLLKIRFLFFFYFTRRRNWIDYKKEKKNLVAALRFELSWCEPQSQWAANFFFFFYQSRENSIDLLHTQQQHRERYRLSPICLIMYLYTHKYIISNRLYIANIYIFKTKRMDIDAILLFNRPRSSLCYYFTNVNSFYQPSFLLVFFTFETHSTWRVIIRGYESLRPARGPSVVIRLLLLLLVEKSHYVILLIHGWLSNSHQCVIVCDGWKSNNTHTQKREKDDAKAAPYLPLAARKKKNL